MGGRNYNRRHSGHEAAVEDCPAVEGLGQRDLERSRLAHAAEHHVSVDTIRNENSDGDGASVYRTTGVKLGAAPA